MSIQILFKYIKNPQSNNNIIIIKNNEYIHKKINFTVFFTFLIFPLYYIKTRLLTICSSLSTQSFTLTKCITPYDFCHPNMILDKTCKHENRFYDCVYLTQSFSSFSRHNLSKRKLQRAPVCYRPLHA